MSRSTSNGGITIALQLLDTQCDFVSGILISKTETVHSLKLESYTYHLLDPGYVNVLIYKMKNLRKMTGKIHLCSKTVTSALWSGEHHIGLKELIHLAEYS